MLRNSNKSLLLGNLRKVSVLSSAMIPQGQILGSNYFQYPTSLSYSTILLQCKIQQNFDVTGSDIAICQIQERDDDENYWLFQLTLGMPGHALGMPGLATTLVHTA